MYPLFTFPTTVILVFISIDMLFAERPIALYELHFRGFIDKNTLQKFGKNEFHKI